MTEMSRLANAVAANVRASFALAKFHSGAPDEPKQFYVYFVSAAVEGYPIKIGITTDKSGRFSTIRNAMPFDLVVFGYMPVETKSAEKEMHNRFRHLRLRGEWFQRTSELMEFIKNSVVRQEGDQP